MLTASFKDNGATIDLTLRQQLMIQLDGNRTTGFTWLLVDRTGQILEPVGEAPLYQPAPDAGGLFGAGGMEVWTFRPLRPGTGLLRFEYRRPWENGREALRSAVFNIRVR